LLFDKIDISWNKIAIESLFENIEKLDIQKTLYPTDAKYDKKHFNDAIEQLFID
jgi:hypothetical protein